VRYQVARTASDYVEGFGAELQIDILEEVRVLDAREVDILWSDSKSALRSDRQGRRR
jgi:hypothetical protein